MASFVPQLLRARERSVPLVSVASADPRETVTTLVRAFREQRMPGEIAALVQWDCVRGLQGLEEHGRAAVAALGDPRGTVSPVGALTAVLQLPENAVAFFVHLGRHVDNPQTMQALWNVRDEYKRNSRMLIVVGPELRLPPELQHDIVTFDEPLPDREHLATLVADAARAGQEANAALTIDERTSAQAGEAVAGLPSFEAEQLLYLALNSTGLDLESLWERKRQAVRQTPGLFIDPPGETFSDLAGLDGAKDYLRLHFDGPERPALVVVIEEFEKVLAGSGTAGGDTSGVSQDQKGELLRCMEDYKWDAALFLGPPGVAKTALARAVAPTFGAFQARLDLGAAKDRWVGASEQMIRAALKALRAIGGSRVLILATANSLETVTPDLHRRFTSGMWYFQIPSAEERAAIWRIHVAAHGLDAAQKWPPDNGWTGAEIRNCCRIARKTRLSLFDAARYVIPVAQSDPMGIETLECLADGRFLSAATGIIYARGGAIEKPRRVAKL